MCSEYYDEIGEDLFGYAQVAGNSLSQQNMPITFPVSTSTTAGIQTTTNTGNITGIGTGQNTGITYPQPSITTIPTVTTPYTNFPYTYVPSTTTVSANYQKYSTMDLPRNDMPIKVYVNGKLVTLGIIGTDVECAYCGQALVFSPGTVSSFLYMSKHTIIIEYKDEIYYYNIDSISSQQNVEKINANLLSCVKK